MNVAFISDLHLQDAQPALTAGFLTFLETRVADCPTLYILGDLFEFWIGDDVLSATSQQVARALRQRQAAGMETFFIAGNRDFLLGESFAQTCGMTLLEGPVHLSLAGHSAVLIHGDELCTDDAEYQQFRQMVRNRAWQENFLAMPVEQRLQIAAQARSASQQANAEKSEYIMDVNQSAVEAFMQQHHADLLIHGHTHRPARHALTVDDQPAERIVLGDWGAEGWCLGVEDKRLDLYSFPV